MSCRSVTPFEAAIAAPALRSLWAETYGGPASSPEALIGTLIASRGGGNPARSASSPG